MAEQPNFGTFELLNDNDSDPEEAIVFIGQLFAWAYLSQKYRDEIKPNIFEIDLESLTKSELEKHLRALSTLKLSESTARELRLIDALSDSRKILREQARNPMVLRFNFTLLERITDGELEAVLTQINRITLLTLIPYETIAEQFKTALIENKKRAGWFGPPEEVASLICGLANLAEGDSVYCPHALSFRLAELASQSSKNVNVELIEMPGAGAVLRPFYLVNLFNNSAIQLGRTNTPSIPAFAKDGRIPQFSKTVAVLPWGRKIGLLDDLIGLGLPRRQTSEEIFYIRHALAQTTGTAIFLVSNSVLFRSGIEEQALRQDLVESRRLKAVIGLPDGLFPNTSLGTSILVIDQQETADETVFFDASTENFHQRTHRAKRHDYRRGTSRLAGWKDVLHRASQPNANDENTFIATPTNIAALDYNLLPNRYVLDPAEKLFDKLIHEKETWLLGDIASIVRAQSLKHKNLKDSESEAFLEIRLSDIDSGGSIRMSHEEIFVPKERIGRAQKMLVRPGDILLSVKGTIGTAGLVGEEIANNAVPSQSFVILRLDTDKTPLSSIALLAYLSSSVVRGWLKARATGTVMKSLANKDLIDLPIPKVTADFVSLVNENYQKLTEMCDELATLQVEVRRAHDTMWPLEKNETQYS